MAITNYEIYKDDIEHFKERDGEYCYDKILKKITGCNDKTTGMCKCYQNICLFKRDGDFMCDVRQKEWEKSTDFNRRIV